MTNLGWKRVRDKSDDTIRLRWCELKSTINYAAFKEGLYIVILPIRQFSFFSVSETSIIGCNNLHQRARCYSKTQYLQSNGTVSVCLSRSGIVPKQLNLSSKFFHHLIV